MSTTLSIDTTRIEKARKTDTTITGRCPACAASGGDRRGVHFFLNLTDGKFGCSAHQGDSEHRREIFRLVGIKGERQTDHARDRQLRESQRRARQEAEARQRLVQTAKAKREEIVERWRWDKADLWESSPQRIDQPLVESDPRWLIQSLFAPGDVVWTGEVFQSGSRHAARWRTAVEWMRAPEDEAGPMIAPAIWKPGTSNRTSENVLSAPFTVLDFDEIDGRKPETPAEIAAHVAASLAIVRWLREGMRWKLAAIVWTGSKSIHGWFRNPGPAALQSLRDAAGPLGIDAGLIGRGEHPCRLPGQRHSKTGNLSRCLWLQAPRD